MNYWELGKAVKEMEWRREDKTLLNEVNAILGDCPIPEGRQLGFLSRHLATCRFEDILFKSRCEAVGLDPLWLEYGEDIFTTNNPSKVRLIKIKVFCGFGRRGGLRLKTIWLTKQPKEWERKPILEIITDKGESLAQLHSRLRLSMGWSQYEVMDISSWLKSYGQANNYYKYYFLVMVTRGILFESFESPGFPELEKFKKSVVIPAWEWVIRQGFPSPLIVLHPSAKTQEQEERILNWYPQSVLCALT